MNAMLIFGVAMVMVGIYLMVSGGRMKGKKELGSVILAKEEMEKCRDKDAFIAFIYWKLMITGGTVLLLGIVWIMKELQYINMGVFYCFTILGIGAVLWFFYSLKKAREIFLS